MINIARCGALNDVTPTTAGVVACDVYDGMHLLWIVQECHHRLRTSRSFLLGLRRGVEEEEEEDEEEEEEEDEEEEQQERNKERKKERNKQTNNNQQPTT